MAIAAWGLTAGAAPARVGTVSGAIVYSGGPAHAGATPRAGRVTATRAGRVEARVHVRAGRRFRMHLRKGRYVLRAASGDAHCLPKRVRVRPAATVKVNIVCSVR